MNLKILVSGKLVLFSLLSLLDLALTYRLLHGSGGHFYEGNPLAGFWLKLYGWTGLTAYKLFMMVLVASAAGYVAWHRPRTGNGVLTFACLTVAGVVFYSCCLLHRFDSNLARSHDFYARYAERVRAGRERPLSPEFMHLAASMRQPQAADADDGLSSFAPAATMPKEDLSDEN